MDKLFKTHKGEIVTGGRLQSALNQVADEMIRNSHAIKKENAYAPHVTEDEKLFSLQKRIDLAEQIREGQRLNNFGTWQNVNYCLTGECIGFLPK